MKKLIIFLLISLYLNILISSPVLAEVKINDYFKTPFKDLGSLISTILPNVFIIAGVLLFVLLIFGGLSFIISAGKGEEKGAEAGKNMVTYAIIGFILIFASYWIMQIISYITGINFLEPKF